MIFLFACHLSGSHTIGSPSRYNVTHYGMGHTINHRYGVKEFISCFNKDLLTELQLYTGHLIGCGKKITNYADIFRNIMRKKVLIMRKTRWIMQKIFRSLHSPRITSFHAAQIELPPKPRVCSRANFKQKQLYWYLGFSSYFHLYLVCYEIILSIM